jgi:hypothetical protein
MSNQPNSRLKVSVPLKIGVDAMNPAEMTSEERITELGRLVEIRSAAQKAADIALDNYGYDSERYIATRAASRAASEAIRDFQNACNASKAVR